MNFDQRIEWQHFVGKYILSLSHIVGRVFVCLGYAGLNLFPSLNSEVKHSFPYSTIMLMKYSLLVIINSVRD